MDIKHSGTIRIRFIAVTFVILLAGCASYEVKRFDCTQLPEGCIHRQKTYEYRQTKNFSALWFVGQTLNVAAFAMEPTTGFADPTFGFNNSGSVIPLNRIRINQNLWSAYPECKEPGWDALFQCVKEIDIKEGRLKVADQ